MTQQTLVSWMRGPKNQAKAHHKGSIILLGPQGGSCGRPCSHPLSVSIASSSLPHYPLISPFLIIFINIKRTGFHGDIFTCAVVFHSFSPNLTFLNLPLPSSCWFSSLHKRVLLSAFAFVVLAIWEFSM